MTENHEPGESVGQLLNAWSELPTDPQAMEQVAALMVAGVRAKPQAEASEPSEGQFRLLTYLWATLALSGYLARNLIMNWFAANPTVTVLLIAFVCLSLVTPLLLLPILCATDGRNSSPC